MYPVVSYLKMLKLAKRSPQTLKTYRNVLDRFARFVGVPISDLHKHLTPEHLIDYAESLEGRSERGIRLDLSIIHRFYTVNGVTLGELETNVLKPPVTEPLQDKPLTLDLLQKLMDIADVRGKAIITTLVSTGMRPGECSRLLLSDYDGEDTITVPNKIAKNGHGGKVYLTAEAREFLTLFLHDRAGYVRRAHSKKYSHGKPEDDNRLFGVEYSMLCNIFKRLYRKVDGERGKYRDRITIHSTRKYFRTYAVSSSFTIDMVESVMRHRGYLSESYLRLSEQEIRAAFHQTEDQLYITRRDRRLTDSKMAQLEDEIRKMQEKLALSGIMSREDSRGK